MLLPSYKTLSWLGIRRPSLESAVFSRAVGRLNLSPPRMDLEAKRFSGGNQQKLVIARWLNDTSQCCFLMLDEPTQGVDVGARSDIYAALRESAAAGTGLLVTSSEPEELLQIADRVIILSHGHIVAVLQSHEIEESRMLSLAHDLAPTAINPSKGHIIHD